MQVVILQGKKCIKRGKKYYAVKHVESRTDYWASRQSGHSNWVDSDRVHLGDNRVIVNQK